MLQEIIRQLKNREPLAPLCPTEIWKPELSQQLAQTSDDQLFDEAASNDEQREMRLACRAGLLLLNDDLDASHRVSQQIDTPTGAFWHAIMHRREGDFSNANYWWKRAGKHPAFDDAYTSAMSTLMLEDDEDANAFAQTLRAAGAWLPEEFVAICERAAEHNQERDWMRRLQRAEIMALLKWCRERT